MTAHAERANARAQEARATLDQTAAALREAAARAAETKALRASATAETSQKRLRELIVDDATAAEHHALCLRAHEQAAAAQAVAQRAVASAEQADDLVAMHERGVQPIVALELEIEALAKELETRRQEQHALFATEVQPRQTPWFRQTMLQTPPPNHYESVADLVARHRGTR